MSRARIHMWLLLAGLATGCGGSGTTAPSPVSTSGPDLQRQTAHFDLYYAAADASCIDTVAAHLEANQPRICDDLKFALNFRVVIRIYPNLTALHQGMNAPSAPDWVIGLTNLQGEIKVISPLNPGPGHTYDYILRVMDHEFTHAVVLRGLGATRLPQWLQEGIACYEGRMMDESAWAGIQSFVTSDRIPSFSTLDATITENAGYTWAYTMVDFAASRYGGETLRPWIDNGGSFERTFGVEEATFRAAWIEYLKAHYATAR